MSNRLPLVYVAAPYSEPDPAANVHRVCRVWRRLWETDLIAPVAPHWSVIQQTVSPMAYRSWLVYDIQVLRRCDALLRLPGPSTGADGEVAEAKRIGLPVFRQDGEDPSGPLLGWAERWIEKRQGEGVVR